MDHDTQEPADRITLGSAIFMLHEPHRGHELAYNRWYERDHFYAGGMMAPWTIAGRRWVATSDLKRLRYPESGPFGGSSKRGSYLATYWIHAGRFEEMQAWATAETDRLRAAGRMFEHRDLVSGTGYDYVGGAFRDADGVPAEIALDHPYPGLVMTVVDRGDDVAIGQIASRLLSELLPGAQDGTPIAMSLVFAPRPLPPNWPKDAPTVPGVGRRLVVLSFLETDPRECWTGHFDRLGGDIEASANAQVAWVSPFVPVVPGTDRYTDELW